MRLIAVLLLTACITGPERPRRPLTAAEARRECIKRCRHRYEWCADSARQTASANRAFKTVSPGYVTDPSEERNALDVCREQRDMCRDEC